jgi:hypothetical protein
MQINLCGKNPNRLVKVAWLSMQPDGSISFGLTEKTFVSPSFIGRMDVFNLYNQVAIEFLLDSNPNRLRGVINPHFTFHPRMLFHLTDSGGRDKKNVQEVFRGINDVELSVAQYGFLPWIRAISPPMSKSKTFGLRNTGLKNHVLSVESQDEMSSVGVEVDFVHPSQVDGFNQNGVFSVKWHSVAIVCKLSVCPGQLSTLGWFHSS